MSLVSMYFDIDKKDIIALLYISTLPAYFLMNLHTVNYETFNDSSSQNVLVHSQRLKYQNNEQCVKFVQS